MVAAINIDLLKGKGKERKYEREGEQEDAAVHWHAPGRTETPTFLSLFLLGL